MNWSRCSRTLLLLFLVPMAAVAASNVTGQRRVGREKRATAPDDSRGDTGEWTPRARTVSTDPTAREMSPDGETGSRRVAGRSSGTTVPAANSIERTGFGPEPSSGGVLRPGSVSEPAAPLG